MALIAILISLVVERLLGSMEELRQFDWFFAYHRRVAAYLARIKWLNGPLGALLLLLPLIAPVVAIDYYLSGMWLLFGLAFAVLVLLFCFGPRDLEAEVEAFVDARARDDEESACWHASELLGGEEVKCSAEVTQRIMQNIFVEANERLLAIVFWFVVLGPGGALLYRLSSLLQQQQAEQAEGEVQSSWSESSRHILIASGFGALRIESGDIDDDSHACEQVSECIALVRRAVLVFLSLVAFFTLAGWMG